MKENNYEVYKVIGTPIPDHFFAADQHYYTRLLSYSHLTYAALVIYGVPTEKISTVLIF